VTTIQKPNTIWKGSPNYNTGHPINPSAPSPQPQQPVVAIIDHITEGGRNSVLAEFQSEASQASTHFMVCTDGQIWQFVDLANSAWGNGIWEAPDVSVPWISDAFKNGKWPNGCTISIEHEGTHGVPLTEPQYQSTLALQRWLLSLYKLPADRNHINGHYQIQSKNRANCPGSAYPWSRLMTDLNTGGTWSGVVTEPFGDPNNWNCVETGKWVNNSQGFLDYWRKNGAMNDFGFPITGAAYDNNYKDAKGNPLVVQWFQRARFEAHPENNDPFKVLLGLVGSELLAKL
jgi:N-acetylmuramoyl-L-alanine amidase